MRTHSTTVPSGSDRLLPHDKDAERAVLGQALLLGRIPSEAQSLSSSDFYSPLHSDAWAAMQQTASEGIGIDLISVRNVLARRVEPVAAERIAATLAKILETRWVSSNLSYYVEIIKTKAAQRAVIGTSSQITELAFSGAGNMEELLTVAEKQAAMLREHCSGKAHLGFPLHIWDLSKVALEQTAQVDWLVEPIMAQPDVVILVGDGGLGKSKLAAAAALSVAFEKPFWGHLQVKRAGRVVYINEERPDLTRRHLHTLAQPMEIDADGISKRITLIGGGSNIWRITDSAARQALIRLIKRLGDVVLIIWDSLHVLHDKEENDNAQMTEAIEGFRRTCAELACCGLLLHHTSKSAPGDFVISARGASAIKDTVDGELIVRRPKEDVPEELRVHQGKTRRSLVRPFTLRMDHDPKGELLGVSWIGEAPTKAEQVLDAVLEVISSCVKPLKSGEIAMKLAGKFRREDVYAALKRVREENLAPWQKGTPQGFLFGEPVDDEKD